MMGWSEGGAQLGFPSLFCAPQYCFRTFAKDAAAYLRKSPFRGKLPAR
jgi:hypothetical protein